MEPQSRKNLIDLLAGVLIICLIVGLGALLLARALGW